MLPAIWFVGETTFDADSYGNDVRRHICGSLLAAGIVAVAPAAHAQTAQPDRAVLATLVGYRFRPRRERRPTTEAG